MVSCIFQNIAFLFFNLNDRALLVYSRLTNKFSYYDSFSGYNFQPARETANKIWKILDCPTKPSFEEVRTPQQKNGFDCGLYCISISEYLGNNYLNRSNESLEKVVTPESINDFSIQYNVELSIRFFNFCSNSNNLF